jgi:hyperosmotically inducible protein
MQKLHRLASIAALSAALGVTFVAAGCSSTPTRESAGQAIDDSVITSKIKAKFVEDSSVSALNIGVETFKGTVQLTGFANNQTEISRAVKIASDIQGVRSVKNDIRLKTAG